MPVRVALLLVVGLLLPGCIGTLDVWGIDVPIPGDDDDDGPPAIDYTVYEGFEFINVDWDQDQKGRGNQDCLESAGWNVTGDETTADDANLCPTCDHVWTLLYVAAPGLTQCLRNTNLQPSSDFERKMGFQFNGSNFTVWRNFEDPDTALEAAGIGALREDGSFTWGGGADHRQDEGPYAWYLSGEGTF